jgi:hypothetical protein
MQLGAWRRAALYFASRVPNRVVFRVAVGRQNTEGFACFDLVLIHARGGGRIRTIHVIS